VGRMVKPYLKDFFIKNYLIYIFMILFLIMGIVFGALGVKALTPEQFTNLNKYIDTGFQAAANQLDYQTVAKNAVWRNIATVLKIWFLGLTVIGIPLILVIIFTRGFVLGFTVGFFLERKTLEGIGIIILSIFPQNLLLLPAIIVAGASATVFSIYLLKGRTERMALSSFFLRYSLIMFVIACIMVLAGLVEGYVIPLTLKIFKY